MAKIQQMKKESTLSQAIKYLFVGGFCTIVDIGLLFLFTEYLNIHYILSGTLSFVTGVTINYFMCTGWIFKESKIKNKGMEFLLYLFVSFIGLGINLCILWLLTSIIGTYFIISKLIAIAVTLTWNFCSRKYLLHI